MQSLQNTSDSAKYLIHQDGVCYFFTAPSKDFRPFTVALPKAGTCRVPWVSMQKSAFRWLYTLFFLSGFPALIYQIVWQRTLFAIYGVNIESVTMVVSAFMLGLGLGSLGGGRISKNASAPLLLLFAAVELGVAAFGAISLPLFHWVANFTAGAPPLETGLISFALVLIPTVLMGATLPLLVAQLVKLSGNVGQSVGTLYFVNTLGSAVACFAAGMFLMRQLGMSGSVTVAVTLNILAALVVLFLHFRWRSLSGDAPAEVVATNSIQMISFPVALALAAASGFISLCYEIVWYRLYSFASEGTAQCFAYVLGTFLTGIAFGSLLGRGLCKTASVRSIGMLVLLANVVGFAIVPVVAFLVRFIDYSWTLPLVAIAAGLLGATFPLMCHISVPPDSKAGQGLSYLYLSNIIGSAAGSWLVGFVLMDYLSLQSISLLLALLGVGVATPLFAASQHSGRDKLVGAVAAAALCLTLFFAAPPLFAPVYDELQSKRDYGKPKLKIIDVVETRSGVISVNEDREIFGSGVYDGMLSTDLMQNEILERAFAISLFHPNPKEVLMIGLSGGAWSQVIANHPQVEKVTVIEINPGYLDLMTRYPDVAPQLKNPKVEVIIDDGRRWMFRNKNRKYDFIVMDTIYHHRAHATNLLSTEMMDLARELLKPGGVLYFNSTYSEESQRTGAVKFPYAYRFGPVMAVSDSPILLDKARWRQVLVNYRLEGKPALDLSLALARKRLDEILAYVDTLPGTPVNYERMETREILLKRTEALQIVTDDNMVTEWR